MQTACFHIDGFPSWVRSQRSSGSPRRAVVAVHHRRRIVCCTPALRSAGLLVGEDLARARRLFPDATFHPSDPDLEEAIWESLLGTLADAAPFILPAAPGHAFLRAYDVAALASLAEAFGAGLGVAPSRLVAMLAALEAGPGATVKIDEKEIPSFLAQVSVARLEAFGYEPEMIERLELFGIGTIGRLMNLGRRHLQSQFGGRGAALHDLLHPASADPPIPLYQPPQIVSASYDLEHPSVEPGDLMPVLEHLVAEVTTRLEGVRAHLLTLRLSGRGPRGGGLLRRVFKRPAAAFRPIRAAAARLLEQMLAPDNPVDAITLELGGLLRPELVQETLFAERPLVYETVRLIHRRFPGRLLRATIIDPDSYIPEQGIRLEPYPPEPPLVKKRRKKR